MLALSSLIKSSFIIFIFGLTSGVFNYFYYFFAAKTLSFEPLGVLNYKIAIFQMIFIIPAFIYNILLLKSFRKNDFLFFLLINIPLIGISLLFLKNDFGLSEENYINVIFILSLLLGCCSNAYLGILQKKLFFGSYACIGLIAATTRTAYAFFSENQILFAQAFLVSFICSSLFGAFLIFLKYKSITRDFDENSNKYSIKSIYLTPFSILKKATPSFLIGLLSVYLPNHDIVWIKILLDDASTGAAAQVQLFSKIIYFGPMILLQVTFPYYIKILKNKTNYNDFRLIRKFEIFGFIITALLIATLSYFGPIIGSNFFKNNILNSSIIALSCIPVLSFYFYTSSIQIFATLKNYNGLIYIFLILLFFPIILFLLKPTTILQYFWICTWYHGAMGVAIFIYTEFKLHNTLKKTSI